MSSQRELIDLRAMLQVKIARCFSTHLMATREEVVVEIPLPMEASQAEVKVLLVSAVKLPLEHH